LDESARAGLEGEPGERLDAPMRSSVGRVDLWCEEGGGTRWRGSGRGCAGAGVGRGRQCGLVD